MLERLCYLDDPGFPTETGDGESDESEDTMQLSEARAELYAAVERFEGKDASDMSRLPWKHGYTAGETIEVDPHEWSVTKVGYLTEVAVTYKTADGKLKTEREQVAGNVEEKVQEMLAKRSITYPD